MKDLIEIRWHGRGGQGAKTAALRWLMLLSIMVSMFRASQNTVLKEWELPLLLIIV